MGQAIPFRALGAEFCLALLLVLVSGCHRQQKSQNPLQRLWQKSYQQPKQIFVDYNPPLNLQFS
jgi:hypothetical protein